EITSLLSLCGGQFSSQQEVRVNSPFWILNIPSEEMARGLMKRTVCFYLQWLRLFTLA
uniref:Uncharacterized protein n=1 Tax=Pavo cristatus TaxID=9049 RepID=A0A8C9G3M9_PAVCR